MSRNMMPAMILVFGAFTLMGCSENRAPETAVENYLRALEAKDDIGAVNASCLEWEEGAFAEASSFDAVGVDLKGLACSAESASSDEATVHCSGEFIADYGGELQNIDVSLRTFLVVRESGLWKMCGYR